MRDIFIPGVYNRLPKVQSLKKSLIGQKKFHDCSVIMRLLLVRVRFMKRQAKTNIGKKAEKITGGEGTRAGTQTAGGGGKTGISYSGVTCRIMRRESRN